MIARSLTRGGWIVVGRYGSGTRLCADEVIYALDTSAFLIDRHDHRTDQRLCLQRRYVLANSGVGATEDNDSSEMPLGDQVVGNREFVLGNQREE